jgi:ferredoxin
MAKIFFNNKELNINSGISILNFANNNGFFIPSQCEVGTCTTCMVKILKGQQYLIEKLEDSTNILSKTNNILSCITELNPDFENNNNIEILIEI